MSEGDRRIRVWLPAAAAVVALAVSGTFALTQTSRQPQQYAEATAPVRIPVNDSLVDQCWTAAQKLRGTVEYPDRAQWRPVFAVAGSRTTVIAFRTGSRPLFCETNYFSVTLSDPVSEPGYAYGSRTAAMLVTEDGAVAGVLDPAWANTTISVTSDGDRTSRRAETQDGLFIWLASLPGSITSMSVRRAPGDPEMPLPKPKNSYGTVESNLDSGDHSTTDGVQLYRCINAVEPQSAVPDQSSWSMGGHVQSGADQLFLATNSLGVSVCTQKGNEPAQFLPYVSTRTWSPVKPTLLSGIPAVAGRPVVAGLLPPSVGKMRITFADKTTMDIKTYHNTFAVLMPPGPKPPAIASCTLFSIDGAILYNGPAATG
ncbi:hypothetical protein [Actinocrispum sp. NPDC049592]|uniref:hypothetical protein n=1 Tax=Actinocrispum sp. NPDC049592 TaxID=3154835 RepID=UPI00343AB18F